MMNSEHICGDCFYAPSSHSFKRIGDYYYCCPSSATKYYDIDGIEHHMRVELSKDNNRPWTLILDIQGYRLKHSPCINAIIKLSHTYCFKYLQQVIVINQNLLFKLKLNTSWYSLSKSIREKLFFDDTNKFSKLLQMTKQVYEIHD